MSTFHSPGVSLGLSRVHGAEDGPQLPTSCGAALLSCACKCLGRRSELPALSSDLLCVWSAWTVEDGLWIIHVARLNIFAPGNEGSEGNPATRSHRGKPPYRNLQ